MPARAFGACALGIVAIVTGSACAERSLTGPGRDDAAPSVQLVKQTPPADSMLAFDVNVDENLGIRSVSVRILGGANNQVSGG